MRESSGSSWICFWMGDMEVSMRGAGHHRPPAATPQGMGPLFSLGRLHSLPGLQWREPADSSNPVQSPQFKGALAGEFFTTEPPAWGIPCLLTKIMTEPQDPCCREFGRIF